MVADDQGRQRQGGLRRLKIEGLKGLAHAADARRLPAHAGRLYGQAKGDVGRTVKNLKDTIANKAAKLAADCPAVKSIRSVDSRPDRPDRSHRISAWSKTPSHAPSATLRPFCGIVNDLLSSATRRAVFRSAVSRPDFFNEDTA